jgi:lysozyme family protein
MTTEGFTRSLPRVLVYEGGKVDHPKDPGGRTNQGVIQRVYDSYRRKIGQPIRDVYDMSNTERDAIYKAQYWDAVRGNDLPAGVDFVVFDGAVNSGPKQSIKWLQRALGVQADGSLGMITMDALESYANHDALIVAIIDRREAFLRALKTFPTFGKGWLSRLASVEKTGQAWATGDEAPTPTFSTAGAVKAPVEDAKLAPSKGVSDAATGGGVGAGGIGAVLQTAQETLTPYSSAGGWIQNVVIILIIAGVVMTVGGLAYRWYASRKKAELADALDLQPVS